MSKFKVLLTDFPWPDLEIERTILAEHDAELVVAPLGDEAMLAALAADVDAIMTCWADVSATVIDATTRCQIVARLGIGLDNIDVARATDRGIPVTNVPDYCLTEVAEHTLALLLALARKLPIYDANARRGIYDLKAGLPIQRVEGQTLGIVGLGQIGRRVAEKAHALGLRILATSRSRREAKPGIHGVQLDQLLEESDYVSLHVPLTPETRHMIGTPQLALMKPTAYLINTARGGLVDHAALARALSENRIAGAALDVQDPEPPDLSRPPYNDPRVLVTPHAAFVSEQAVSELRTRAARQMGVRLSGGRPENIVNPDALRH